MVLRKRLREELWDWAPPPGNKIYAAAVADLVLIVSQLSKNLLNEAAVGLVYWTESRKVFTEPSAQVSSFTLCF